jgi:hypothetical protein
MQRCGVTGVRPVRIGADALMTDDDCQCKQEATDLFSTTQYLRGLGSQPCPVATPLHCHLSLSTRAASHEHWIRDSSGIIHPDRSAKGQRQGERQKTSMFHEELDGNESGHGMAGMGLELELAWIRRYANAITGRRFLACATDY